MKTLEELVVLFAPAFGPIYTPHPPDVREQPARQPMKTFWSPSFNDLPALAPIATL